VALDGAASISLRVVGTCTAFASDTIPPSPPPTASNGEMP
jgi:hypothetical protein